MRSIGIVAILLVRVAAADPSAAQLRAEGEALAQQQRFSEAIDKFKAADRLQPTASHACLIALAYLRRELWPQAEIFLATCQARATAGDPVPDWAPLARQQLDERFATVNVAAVDIAVTPRDAQLAVSSFAPDERFAPRTIHLPPGHHVIVASAPGYEDASRAIDVVDRTPVHLAIELHKREYRTPGRLMLAGAITFGAGAITFGVMALEWTQLRNAQTTATFDANRGAYEALRVATAALWTAGAALAVTGYVMHRRHRDAPTVGALPLRGGGAIVVGWDR